MPSRNRPTVERSCAACGTSFRIERYRARGGEGIYCSRDCYAASRSRADADTFWANTRPAPNGCIEWTGAPTKNGGYGRLRVHGQIQRAHRVAYELAHGMTAGSLPRGRMVCHSCDNPICVNPSHLFLGDGFANMRDMAAKGRAAGFRRKGEAHPLAKLTDAQIADYRVRWVKKGRYGNGKVLAAESGVTYDYFIRLLAGKNRPPAQHLP